MLWRTIRRTPASTDPFGAPASRRERRRIDQHAARLPRPRRGLPDSRAVVGGLLVATAALGSWWVTAGAGQATPTSYLVAARPIDPGQRINADDVRFLPLTLSPAVAASAFTDARAVAGSVALGPIGAGGLIQEHTIGPSTGTRSGREISFAVETPWAVDGALRSGDRIDVFATSTESADGRTTKVLAGVVVRHLSSTGGGLGEPTGLTITVAVDDLTDLDAAVSALRIADLTVARATGVTSTESQEPDAASGAHRGDPMPRSGSTTTSTPRSARPSRAVTTTTVRSGR